MRISYPHPAKESTSPIYSLRASNSLHDDLSIVIKAVNYIKGFALNTRLFWRFCQDLEAGHDTLLFHTQMSDKLSKGNMLRRILELFIEVVLFLGEQGKTILLEKLRNDDFRIRLAYLIDVLGNLMNSTRSFKEMIWTFWSRQTKIKAFVDKLDLWKCRVERCNFVSFVSLSDCVGDDVIPKGIAEDIADHLTALRDEFQRYCCRKCSTHVDQKSISMWGWNCWRGISGEIPWALPRLFYVGWI